MTRSSVYDARVQLADNVRRLMGDHPDLATPAKLARRCFWMSGAKKGRPLSERQIRYVLDRRPDADPPIPSPSLEVIEAIAKAFNVPAWQLLVDDRELRLWMVGKLFTAEEAVSDARVEKHLPPPPADQTSTRKGKRA